MMEDGKIMIFSRNSENLSGKYPDLIERMPLAPKEGTTSFVIDCEAVAWDPEKNFILPFQVLSTRKRKVKSLANNYRMYKLQISKFKSVYLPLIFCT